LGVFKWLKFKLGLAKIGQVIQIEMGTQEKTYASWQNSGLEV
jgi:hypothetical protein